MKKLSLFLFLVATLAIATIGTEFLKPYVTYYVSNFTDKSDPFNFKNEYELLIWSNEQKETKEGIKKALSLVKFEQDIGNEDIFLQCVVEKNIQTLNDLNNDNSKLNPVNPKTVNELENLLKKYQPLMINVQNESVQACLPKQEIDTREDILLSCQCIEVIGIGPFYREMGSSWNCMSKDYKKGLVIDFKNKKLIYGGIPYPLMEDESFYYGIDSFLWYAMMNNLSEERAASIENAPLRDTFKTIHASAVKIERLTGNLTYNSYLGFYPNKKGLESYNLGVPDGSLSAIPAYTVDRNCSRTEKL